jgi:hypothetical protein
MEPCGLLAKVLIIVIYLMAQSATATDLVVESPQEIVIALGTADVFDSSKYAGFGIEYRYSPFWKKLRPIVGYSMTREHDQYVYMGIRYFFVLNDEWLFNPTFAVGLFDSGNGINLGGSVEFRSGFEFSHRVSENVRLGIGLAHLSNSRIYKSNPGTETVELSLAVTL